MCGCAPCEPLGDHADIVAILLVLGCLLKVAKVIQLLLHYVLVLSLDLLIQFLEEKLTLVLLLFDGTVCQPGDNFCILVGYASGDG